MEVRRTLLQDLLLRTARDTRLRRVVEAPPTKPEVVRRYVAGETIGAALDVVVWLGERGRDVSLTHLATDPPDADAAQGNGRRVRKLIRRLAAAGLAGDGRADVSLRLSALGAALGPHGADDAIEHACALCAAGESAGVSVTVETEPSVPIDATLAAVAALAADHRGVGVALQACERRSEADCRDLVAAGIRVRLSKGVAASEPARFRRRADVDRSFARCLAVLMAGPAPVAVATGDERLLAIAETLARRYRRGRDRVEYVLRYGDRPALQAVIADRGDRCRVYVPFGEDWYPYLLARVADHPADLVALVRAVAH